MKTDAQMVKMQEYTDQFVPIAKITAHNKNNVSKLIFFILHWEPDVVRYF